MAPLDPSSHFSAGPVLYTALATEPEDPPHPDNPYSPSASYPADNKAQAAGPSHPRPTPLMVDGTPRSQIEFLQSELAYLRAENTTLKEANQKAKDEELERLRAQVKATDEEKECRQGATTFFAGIGALVLLTIAIARLT